MNLKIVGTATRRFHLSFRIGNTFEDGVAPSLLEQATGAGV